MYPSNPVSITRILHLDDQESDHDLIKLEIESRKFPASFIYVKNKEEYAAALERREFDVILSDYKMPGFDGDRARAMARHVCPDVPFIMVTGELGEDRAIETLHRGAWDYILKDNLKRLVPAIERALQEAANVRGRWEAEKKLRANERKLRLITDLAPVYFAYIDEAQHIQFVNKPFAGFINSDPDALIGRRLCEALPSTLCAIFDPLVEQAFGGTLDETSLDFPGPGNTMRHMHVRFSRELDESGSVIGLVVTCIDLTDQKRLEEELERRATQAEEGERLLNALMENINEGIAITGGPPDFPLRTVSRFGTDTTGRPADTLVGMPSGDHQKAWEIFLADGVTRPAPEQMPLYRASRFGEIIHNEEMVIRRANGRDVTVLVNAAPVRDGAGNIILCLNTWRDISERKQIQRALEESQAQYRALFEKSPLPKWLISLETFAFLDVNEACIRRYGYSREELLTMSLADIRTSGEFAKFLVWVEQRPEHLEGRSRTRHRKKNGKIIDVEVFYREISYYGRRAALAEINDITEQTHRTAERERLLTEIERQKGLLEAVVKFAPIGIGILQGKEHRYIMVNPAFQPFVSGKGDVIGRTVPEVFPEISQTVLPLLDRVYETGEAYSDYNVPFKLYRNGIYEDTYFTFINAPWYDAQGAIQGVMALAMETTETMRVQQQIRESEERLSLTAEATGVGMFDYHPQTGELYWTDIAKRHFGLPADAHVDYEVFLNGLHPDDKEATDRAVRAVLKPESGGSYITEYRTIGIDDGKLRWLQAQGRVFFDAGGNAIRLIGATLDITERKQAEENYRDLYLLASRQAAELSAVIESMPDAVYIGTLKGITHANTHALRMLGATSLEDLQARIGELGTKFNVRWAQTGVPLREDELQFVRALRGETVIEEVLATNAQTGEDIHIRSACAPIIHDGSVVGAVAINSDITGRKRAEETLARVLAEAEEGRNTLTALMEHIPMGITIADAPDVTIRMVSRHGLDVLERSPTEIAHIPAPDHPSRWGIYHADGVTPGTPEELPLTRATVQGEVVSNEEWIVTRKDGTLVPILCNAAPIRNNQGEIVGGVIGWQDITERRLAENALRESEERFRIMADGSPVIIWVTNAEGGIQFVNRTYVEFFGATIEDVLGGQWQPLVHPDDAEAYIGAYLRSVRERTPFHAEARVRRADGTWRWVASYGEPRFAPDGTFLGHGGISPDITGRKELEDQLRATIREKEVLLREVHHRVKNNLQLISSMINLQTQYIKDKDTLELFDESRNRIRTIALVHEQLYRTKDLSMVDLAEYIRNLVTNLVSSYTHPANAIKLDLDLTPDLVKIETAMPVGLIVNELVLNALKHGMNDAGGGGGAIRIALQKGNDEKTRVLTIADSGPGFPAGIDFQKTESLGLQLVSLLVSGLKGAITLPGNGEGGAKIQITFAELNYTERL